MLIRISEERTERDGLVRSNRVIMRTGTSRKMRSSEPRRARYSRLCRSGFVSIQSHQRRRKQNPDEKASMGKPIEYISGNAGASQTWIINRTA